MTYRTAAPPPDDDDEEPTLPSVRAPSEDLAVPIVGWGAALLSFLLLTDPNDWTVT